MNEREQAYHGHQSDAERLDDIRRRHEALRVHSGETDYAHRVIIDCAWLIEQVEALRAQVAELTALGVSMHKAGDSGYRKGYRDGQDDERDATVEYLRGQRGAAGSTIVSNLASGWATDISGGKHRRSKS